MSLNFVSSKDSIFLAAPIKKPAQVAVSQVQILNSEAEPDIVWLIALDLMLAVSVKADEFLTLFCKCSGCNKFMMKRSEGDHRSNCPRASKFWFKVILSVFLTLTSEC